MNDDTKSAESVPLTCSFWGGDPIYLAPVASDHKPLMGEIERLFPTMSLLDRLKVIGLMTETCTSCHNASNDCCCWNDE